MYFIITKAKRLTFDKNLSGKYDYLNDTFSNDYNFNVLANEAGLALKYNSIKVTLSFGNKIAKENYIQKDIFEDSFFSLRALIILLILKGSICT